MGQITDQADIVYDDFNTHDDPASGKKRPDKGAIRSLFITVETVIDLGDAALQDELDTQAALITALEANAGVPALNFNTLAQLDAYNPSPSVAVNTLAYVNFDPSLQNNGKYIYTGGSPGPWLKTIDRVDAETLRAEAAEAALYAKIPTLEEESGAALRVVDNNNRVPWQMSVRGQFRDGVGPCANADYVVYPELDENDRWQLWSVSRPGGFRRQLTSVYDNLAPTFSDDGAVLFWTNNPAFPSGQAAVNPDGSSMTPIWPNGIVGVDSSPNIIFSGDSLTNGDGSTGGNATYPNQVANNFYSQFYRNALSGGTSYQIASLQGGFPMRMRVTGASIPASGPVTVTQANNGVDGTSGFYTGAVTSFSYNGFLRGIYGAFSGAVGGVMTFTRAVAGSITACPNDSFWIPEKALTYQNAIQCIWAGTNDSNAAWTSTTIPAMIAFIAVYNPRFLVLSLMTRDYNGTANRIAFDARNATMMALAPDNWIDLVAVPTADEMAAVGFSPDANDLIDIANGVWPRGMVNGAPHLNNYGYAVVANRVIAAFDARNWEYERFF